MRTLTGRSGWTVPAALAAIVLLAAALRFVGVDRELPHLREPDAYVVCKLQTMRGDGSIALHQIFEDRYPSLLARTLALLPYPAIPAIASGPDAERAHLERAGWAFRVVRTASAALSTLFVLLTFLLARRFLPPAGALLAAFFVAVSLISLLFAQQARPHAAQATLALVAVLLSLRVRERPSPARIALALLAAAASAATLQNGVFALLPLATATFLGRREAGRGSSGRVLAPLVVAGLVALAAFAAAAPFYPRLPYIDAQGIHLAPAEGGGHTLLFSLASFQGFVVAAELLWMHDPVLTILAVAGAVLGIDRLIRLRRSLARADGLDLVVLASYTLPYLLVIGTNQEIYERFLLPLLPYLACLAAFALLWIAAQIRERVRDSWARACTRSLVALAFLGLPLAFALRYARAAAADDTLEQASAWIRANVDPRSRILLSPSAALPLLYDAESVRLANEDPAGQTLPWVRYQSLLPEGDLGAPRFQVRLFPAALAVSSHGWDPGYMEEFLRESGAEYVVLEVSKKLRRLPLMRSLERATANLGDLVYRSRAQAPSVATLGPIDYQGVEDLALRLLETDAFGPGVLIYRIRPRRS